MQAVFPSHVASKELMNYIKQHRRIVLLVVLIGLVVVAFAGYAGLAKSNSNQTIKQATQLQESTTTKTDTTYAAYTKPSTAELQASLTPIQFSVTQDDGTETQFDNPYWDLKERGIYVDVVSGEPLFSSRDKYKSGTGWPSFTKPLDAQFIVVREDIKNGLSRVEVRSKYADSHLGHVFNDGPRTVEASGGAEATGLRYCLNSAALRFVPESDLDKENLSAYAASL